MNNKLSVVLATRNEEKNIGRCLASVKDIAEEIIVVDEYSTDKTVEIAKGYNAKVFLESHHDIFHITKQKALDKARNEWILQMDADETITPELSDEIKEVINMTNEEILSRTHKNKKLADLFVRHGKLIEERDGKIGRDTGEVVAFFIPRVNMFLGKPLIHAGVYPDPAIRLVKKGKAHFPAKSVHELMQIDGQVEWLYNNMLHYDSPTLERYLLRLNRYTDLQAAELRKNKTGKGLFGFVEYLIFKPLYTFVNLYFRHKGFMDGVNGFLWSFLSATHFPIAYFKYWTERSSNI